MIIIVFSRWLVTVVGDRLSHRLSLDSVVRGSLYPLFKIWTDSAVHGFLYPPLEIRTESAVRGSLYPA